MRAQRSLIFALLLAAAWVTAVAGWQMVGRMGDSAWQSTSSRSTQSSEQQGQSVSDSSEASRPDEVAAEARRRMVDQQLAARDVKDPRVLDAMRKVPRHLFVPEKLRDRAHEDGPLPIGHEQTISQPYIVGLMTQLAQPHQSAVALDVGTGSGYQAAVLSLLCKEVYSIEILEPLADSARQRLRKLGYDNVTVRHGDGYRGWPEKAPFDLIIVAAAPEAVPAPLIEQLKPGGRLVIPVGRYFQNLMLIEKKSDGTVIKRSVAPVAFVPMTGEAERK